MLYIRHHQIVLHAYLLGESVETLSKTGIYIKSVQNVLWYSVLINHLAENWT